MDKKPPAIPELLLTMIRENLADIPQHDFPEGYRMRHFESGDRAEWIRIQRNSEYTWRTPPNEDAFESGYPSDEATRVRRIFFLVCPQGRNVGTISAWFARGYAGKPWGLVHWVAIEPEHRGKNLGRCILTFAMNRLRAMGHKRAMLNTQTPRLPAIRIYLDFGFVPAIPDAATRQAWKLVQQVIPCKELNDI